MSIEIRNLSALDLRALRDVSLEVQSGSCGLAWPLGIRQDTLLASSPGSNGRQGQVRSWRRLHGPARARPARRFVSKHYALFRHMNHIRERRIAEGASENCVRARCRSATRVERSSWCSRRLADRYPHSSPADRGSALHWRVPGGGPKMLCGRTFGASMPRCQNCDPGCGGAATTCISPGVRHPRPGGSAGVATGWW